jgi:hypothetical protein
MISQSRIAELVTLPESHTGARRATATILMTCWAAGGLSFGKPLQSYHETFRDEQLKKVPTRR